MSKTFTSAFNTERAADTSGFCEVVDIYLRSATPTPVGTTDVIRLTSLPGNFAFFKPEQHPEPEATRGDAATYYYWPMRREFIREQVESLNDRTVITLSNTTGEWASLASSIEWRDLFLIIRLVPTTLGSTITSNDCAVLYVGQIDSVDFTLREVRFTMSNALASLKTVRPAGNMHRNCRFRWADDYCGQLPFAQANYRARTVASGSTTTRIKSSALTEDGALFRHEAQAVTADAGTDKITLTAHGLNNGDRVKFSAASMPGGLTAGTWYYVRDKATNDFKVASTAGGSAIDITSAGTSVLLTSETLYGPDLVDALSSGSITASSEGASGITGQSVTIQLTRFFYQSTPMLLTTGDAIVFVTGSGMGAAHVLGFATGTTYYVIVNPGSRFFRIAYTEAGAYLGLAIDGLTGTGLTYDSGTTHAGHKVRLSQEGHWRVESLSGWGTNTQGYWQIADAQAGLANPLLEPYITFDFGSAKAVKTWLLSQVTGAPPEDLTRLIAIFSSSASNFSSYTHEGYFEIPQAQEQFHELRLPNASSARYWRICVRTKWTETPGFTMLNKVRAFENGVNYWHDGTIQFDATTATAGLVNVSRPIFGSYSGEVVVTELPVAPASGDTFIIRRGCARTFNACCERRNWTQYGGFTTMNDQVKIT